MSFNYKNQSFFINNISIKSVAKNNTTPFFIFTHTKKLEIILRIFLIILKKVNPLTCFSVKSNSNVLIISELRQARVWC